MPDDATLIFRESTALLTAGKAAEALALLDPARSVHPDDAGIACRYADCLHLLARLGEARDAYRRALTLDPTRFDAWYGLGCAALAAGAQGTAVAALERATTVEPTRADARFNLAKALFDLGEIERALDGFALAARLDALAEPALATIASIIPGSPPADNASILAVRQAWARRVEAANPRLTATRAVALEPRRKLRIGYVSAFFGDRHWMKPVWALINHHDRAAFEVHLFSDGSDPSAASGYRDHAEDYVHRVRGVANEALATHIAKMEIDILVDLNAYSFPERLGLFARHPAPIAIGWFNSFATSGLAGMDYIIGDAAVAPPDEDASYSERVLRLSGTYLAFAVNYPVPDVAPPPALKDKRLVFGCLGPHYKITDAAIAAWAAILRAAPHSTLLLRNARLDEASNREVLCRRFAALGIPPERLRLAGRAEHFAFLETYAQIDIALDTFPYNGGTTTMEALWQGVPVLCFNGDRWASRTSRSLVRAAGLEDWVMPTREAYVARAIALATAPETPRHLAVLRHNMRARLLASPACDGVALCHEMEDIYREVAARAAT